VNRSAYGQPILIRDGQATRLQRVEDFNETVVQDLVFAHADCLPLGEIDDTFVPLIPVCTELNTPAGPLDILMVTPSGRLAIVETKLWRNPDARRTVVAQILDYAKELARWEYEDLTREINRRLGTSGNTLYHIARGSPTAANADEAAFVDAVSRTLRRGRFLLLVVGDGIREGAAGIADFLATAGHLEFSFAMVELAVFRHGSIGVVVMPRVLARTVDLHRVVVEIPDGLTIREAAYGTSAAGTGRLAILSPEQNEERAFYRQFWREFVSQLVLDDPGQPPPEPANAQNLFLALPTGQAWISAYFAKSVKRVGVYFRCSNTQLGRDLARTLEADREPILADIGSAVLWNMSEESGGVGVRLPCDDVFSLENRDEIKRFFAEWVNRFVNVFRPRLKRFQESIADASTSAE
jgi:hypothetical protein